MEKDEPSRDELYLPQHIMLMKVALAVVIIRSKPAGVSAAQYTRTLSLQFSQLQINWKEKAVQLQSELLRARQELVCGQLQSELSSLRQSRTVNECEIQDSGLELSKSTPPLLSSNDLLSTQHDQETVARIHSEASNTLEERLALHVKFLQSIAGLQSCHTQLSSITLCDLHSTLRDSLANIITELSEALSSRWLPNVPHIKHVCEELVDKTIDLLQSGLPEPHSNDIHNACSLLLKAIIANLSSTDRHTLSDDCSLLQRMLLSLAQLQDLHSLAVQQLIEFITGAVTTLQSCVEDPSLLDPVMVECLGVAIETLQLLVATPKLHYCVPPSVLTALDELVDGPVLSIAACFPLVSYSVWRIHAMLTAISTQ